MSSKKFPFNYNFEWPWNLRDFQRRRDWIVGERAVAFNLLSFLKTVQPNTDIRTKIKNFEESEIDRFVSYFCMTEES